MNPLILGALVVLLVAIGAAWWAIASDDPWADDEPDDDAEALAAFDRLVQEMRRDDR